MAKEPRYDDLWYSFPVQVFEQARDAASDAIDVAVTLIQLAHQYRDQDPNTTFSTICGKHKTVGGENYPDLLSSAIQRFQILVDGTPIKRFLDRYEKPISLETLQPDEKGRGTASSYHDLALAVACQLLESIEQNLSVADYLNHLRYVTAAGDRIPDHIAKIKSHVDCESGATISAWQAAEPSWLTVRDAARVAACNSGIITREADAGRLKSNGRKKNERRIDAADLTRWILQRSKNSEPGESDEAIEAKLRKAEKK